MNQYDTERLRESLLASPGHAAAEDFETADVCVVNTCTVTEEADKDALRLLRRITRRNPAAQLIVTGCLADRDPEMLRRLFPAARVVGNAGKDEIPALLGCRTVAPGFAISGFHGHARAFVKVQDGCNMHCTYCIIPEVRPTLVTKPFAGVRAEVRSLLAAGYREIVLCGVRLGRYLERTPDGGRIDLVELIERLLEEPFDFRIRLSSLEITDLSDRLIGLLVSSEGRLCPSFHLPLQSGSDAVLTRMQRWYSTGFYRKRIEALRSRVPDAGLFTDVMAGFPGETEAEFEETLDFVRSLEFSGLHVFRYSRREGTPAAADPDQVPGETLRQRSERMHALDRELRRGFALRAVGTRRRVLVEDAGEGLTDHFLKVRLEGGRGASGLVWAEITGAEGVVGRARESEPGLRTLEETPDFAIISSGQPNPPAPPEGLTAPSNSS